MKKLIGLIKLFGVQRSESLVKAVIATRLMNCSSEAAIIN